MPVTSAFRTHNRNKTSEGSTFKSGISSPGSPVLETKPFWCDTPVHKSSHTASSPLYKSAIEFVVDDLEIINEEIRSLNKETAESACNAVRVGLRALQTKDNTLKSLSSQREKSRSTTRALSDAKIEAEYGESGIKELKNSQGMIKLPHFFTSSRHKRKRIGITTHNDKHYRPIMSLEEVPKAGRNKNIASVEIRRCDGLERHDFEPDEKDSRTSEDIKGSLTALEIISHQLKEGAQKIGRDLDSHNNDLERQGEKVDAVQLNLEKNVAKLAHFR
jgi:hypothetical protein